MFPNMNDPEVILAIVFQLWILNVPFLSSYTNIINRFPFGYLLTDILIGEFLKTLLKVFFSYQTKGGIIPQHFKIKYN